MKNLLKITGVIALIAAIGFLGACGGDSDGIGGGGAVVSLGDTLTLSGPVFTWDWDADRYNKFNGTLDIIPHKDVGERGTITAGQLNFTVGTPDAVYLDSIEDLITYNLNFYSMFEDMTAYNTVPVEGVVIDGFGVDSSDWYLELENPANFYSEQAIFVYVDNNVRITGKGTQEIGDEDGYTIGSNDFDITLNKGWNAVCVRTTFSFTSMTVSISLKNPTGFTWWLDDWDGWGEPWYFSSNHGIRANTKDVRFNRQ